MLDPSAALVVSTANLQFLEFAIGLTRKDSNGSRASGDLVQDNKELEREIERLKDVGSAPANQMATDRKYTESEKATVKLYEKCCAFAESLANAQKNGHSRTRRKSEPERACKVLDTLSSECSAVLVNLLSKYKISSVCRCCF